jgi:quercetin dioxygenase-like cupin family protein
MKTIQNAQTPSVEPTVVRLGELVSYQDGSIVSRQFLKKDAGNVTLFAFAEGQGLSEHTAPFDALVQVLDGDAEVVIAGKPYSVAAGESIVMPANRPHAVNAKRPFKMALTMIRSPA